ncbi:MAG: ASCH domain-containing protein [Eubacteriales bacterium]|nr:ASCH domain-containing protein [Eubacteriales bacterium]
MKALSLKEPWASLVAQGIKKMETRSWRTNYRGELLIHASLSPVGKTERERALSELLNAPCRQGFILCRCRLADCVLIDEEFAAHLREESPIEYLCGDYSPGRYAWILEDVRPVLPVRAKGRLGLWECEQSIPEAE